MLKRDFDIREENVKLFSITARNPKQIGHALKRYRLKNSLTQLQISERSGVRQATISRLERGHGGVELETLFKVITALELEVSIRKRRSKE